MVTGTNQGRAGVPTGDSYHQDSAVRIVVGVSAVLALLGVLDGVLMAVQRSAVGCPDGKVFPKGTTDFRCFSHPELGLGIAIVILSLLLGIVIVAVGELYWVWRGGAEPR